MGTLHSPTPDRTITSTRELNFPLEKVYRCWTDPTLLAQWWGPHGFTNTFHEHDLRPGGKWNFMMHGPDKMDYLNECIFIKIEEPHFIAWDHLSKPVFQVQTTFEDLGNEKTKVIFRMVFENPDEANNLRSFITEKNEENFVRQEGVLKSITN